MLHVSMIGCGAIGIGVMELLKSDPEVTFDLIIVPEAHMESARTAVSALAPQARVVDRLNAQDRHPDLLVECAGHHAIEEHIIPALQRGIPCMVVSIGALSEPGLVERLEAAARAGKTQVQLLSGAIGAIDALSAARVGGLDSVVYTGRKPPGAWKDTPADGPFDLDHLQTATVIFEGTRAKQHACIRRTPTLPPPCRWPVSGWITRKCVCWPIRPSPKTCINVEAKGAFGGFELTMRGKPLAANPKTSALTVFSVVRALANRAHALSI